MDKYMEVVYLVCIDFVSPKDYGSIIAINVELEFMATREVRTRQFYMTCKVGAPNLVVESK